MNLQNGLQTGTAVAYKSQVIDLDNDFVAGKLHINNPFTRMSAAAQFTLNWEDVELDGVYESNDTSIVLLIYNTGAAAIDIYYSAAPQVSVAAGDMTSVIISIDGSGTPTFATSDAIDISQITTSCTSGSLFYADGLGGIACSDPQLNFNGTTLSGSADVSLQGSELTLTKNDGTDTILLNYATGSNSNSALVNATQVEVATTDGTINNGVSAALSGGVTNYYQDPTYNNSNVVDSNGVKATYSDLTSGDLFVEYVSAPSIQTIAADGATNEYCEQLVGKQSISLKSDNSIGKISTATIDSTKIELKNTSSANRTSAIVLNDTGTVDLYSKQIESYYAPTGGFVTNANGNTKTFVLKNQLTISGNATTTAVSFTLPAATYCTARVCGTMQVQENAGTKAFSTSVAYQVRKNGAGALINAIGGQDQYSSITPAPNVSVTNSGLVINVGLSHNLPAGNYTLYAEITVTLLVP